MKKIVTIGGGNGHSNLLSGIFHSNSYSKIELQSIVSMSDDGRTTGALMNKFENELWLHLPPPWDLRRCLFSLSFSEFRDDFSKIFETKISSEAYMSSFSLRDLFVLAWANDKLIEYMENKNNYFLNFILPIESSIEWHKFWNILMASLYYNFLKDYNYMLKFMHDLLWVDAEIIPVTIDKALIKATLNTWEIIEKQDSISNKNNYEWKIVRLELMHSSAEAKHNFKIDTSILNADYIIIAPGDLFTSTISNLIIWWVKNLLFNSNAKIIFIWNTTNKWGETENYTVLDFIITLENYLWRNIDYFLANNKKLDLDKKSITKFKNDISVKWGEYIFLTEIERNFLKTRGTIVLEDDFIDRESLYKHDNRKLAEKLQEIIF